MREGLAFTIMVLVLWLLWQPDKVGKLIAQVHKGYLSEMEKK